MILDTVTSWGLDPAVAYPQPRHSLCGSPMGMKCGCVRRYEEPIHSVRQLCGIDCFNTKKLRTVIVSIVKTPSPRTTHGGKFAIRSGCYLLKFVPQTIDGDVVP